MKKISIVIPCFNEVENVELMSFAVINVLEEALPQYDYEILFIDNCSTDGTRAELEKLCAKNKKIKAIFNVTNFGQFNSPFYAMCQSTGDCTICMCCDFQDPVELIPRFVQEWENGHKIVSGIKTSSKENPLVYFLRSVYYKLIKSMSTTEMIEQFTGFGLYDKTFIELLRQLDDPVPFIRGIVAEYGHGFNRIEVEYEQPKRRAGKTHNNFYSLYDAAMLSFTSYTKVGLRLAILHQPETGRYSPLPFSRRERIRYIYLRTRFQFDLRSPRHGCRRRQEGRRPTSCDSHHRRRFDERRTGF